METTRHSFWIIVFISSLKEPANLVCLKMVGGDHYCTTDLSGAHFFQTKEAAFRAVKEFKLDDRTVDVREVSIAVLGTRGS
jgi:hypothetical protein